MQLGNAHETETPPNKLLEKTMDLINNERGRDLALTPHIYANGYGTLVVRGWDAIQNGNLVYIHPLQSDGNLLPNSIIITTNQ